MEQLPFAMARRSSIRLKGFRFNLHGDYGCPRQLALVMSYEHLPDGGGYCTIIDSGEVLLWVAFEPLLHILVSSDVELAPSCRAYKTDEEYHEGRV